MGGHGALLAAVLAPKYLVGVLGAAGWIRRENYGVANLFQQFDLQSEVKKK